MSSNHLGNLQQRFALAMNPRTPVSALRLLATDPDRQVRWAVTLNPRATEMPLSTLRLLATDPYPPVRMVLADSRYNPRTPATILRLLATQPDNNGILGQLLAQHSRTPAAVLHLLATTRNYNTRGYTINGKALRQGVRRIVAMNPRTLESTLGILATDPDEDVRSRVAMNPQTLESTLRVLAADTESTVRSRVAKNPRTPVNILKLLARDSSNYVRTSVAENPSTPPRTLLRIVTDPDGLRPRPDGLNPFAMVQFFSRGNPRVPNLNTARQDALENRSKNVIQAVLGQQHGVNLSLPRSNSRYSVRNVARSPPKQAPVRKSKRKSAHPRASVARSMPTRGDPMTIIQKHRKRAEEAARKLNQKKRENDRQFFRQKGHPIERSKHSKILRAIATSI